VTRIVQDSAKRAEQAAAAKEPVTFSPVSLADFIESDVPRREWAVEGVWAEGTSGVIAGPPKAGKSTLSLELAVSLATRTPFLGLKQFPVNAQSASVTYVQAENSDQRVRRDLDLILEARGLGTMEEVEDLHEPDRIVGERFVPTWEGAHKKGGWVPDLQVLSHPGLDLMDESHQAWLMQHVQDRDYLFLDPIYLLAAANTNDQGDVMRLSRFLSELRDGGDCGVIYTHQLSDKHANGSAASRMLGSTLLHGWYESALFTKRTAGGLFTVEVDALREMGEERKLSIQGDGVGSWYMALVAQDAEDATGREAPRVAEKLTKAERLRSLEAEEPGLTAAEYADRLIGMGVKASERSVHRWRQEMPVPPA
jgi:hypothetical protein